MNVLGLLRTRQWILGRRIALVGLIAFLAFRSYGGSIRSWFQGSGGSTEVGLTRYEFQPDAADGKPVWIIGLKNYSGQNTYDRIELKASYKDAKGNILLSDKLVVRQKLSPGEEQLIASPDIKSRPGATSGTLEVTGAESVSP
jgi:hypothetical protein